MFTHAEFLEECTEVCGGWKFSPQGGDMGDKAGVGVPEGGGGRNAEATPGPLTIPDT